MKFREYFGLREPVLALSDSDELLVMSGAESMIYASSLGGLKSYLGLQNQEAVLSRAAVGVSTAVLAPNEIALVNVPLGKTSLITFVSSTSPARIRLYSSAVYRQADLGRAVTIEPTGEHGLLLELVLTTGNLPWDLSPVVWTSNADPNADIAAAITNLDSESRAITVSFSRLLLEA